MSALLRTLAAACLLLAASAGPLRAQERIESYDIQVQVAADGSLEVAVFGSAEAALETAETLYPARLVWVPPGCSVA